MQTCLKPTGQCVKASQAFFVSCSWFCFSPVRFGFSHLQPEDQEKRFGETPVMLQEGAACIATVRGLEVSRGGEDRRTVRNGVPGSFPPVSLKVLKFHHQRLEDQG